MSDEKEVSISTINQRLSSAFDAGNAVQFSIAAADAVVYAETLEQINERLHDRNKSQEARIKEIELELLSLRALRDAGDEKVPYGYCPVCGTPGVSRERRPNGNDRCRNGHVYPSTNAKPTTEDKLCQQLREARAENTRLEQDLARLKVEYADLESRFDATNEACEIFEKNSKAAADLCDENWKLKAEIERLKVSSFSAPEGATIQSLQSQIATLTAELAALKTAPGTDEVEAISTALLDVLKHIQDHFDVNIAGVNAMRRAKELIESARRSIAARDEAVGLLKHILSCIITVKQENTSEWMEYIAEEVNRINEAMGDLDRVSLRLGGIVIVKGGPEIAEGKNA